MDKTAIKKVHVICKTHLDIGFTDLAKNVLDRYANQFLPASIKLAKEVNIPGERPLFIWTVGSYLIDYAIEQGNEEVVKAVDEAVLRGDIAYHGLPFTLHSELCDENLFEEGLNVARRLDERYHKKTIAAKMTDVPGHTMGIIEPMVKEGLNFLHIGINDVACLADLPPVFLWEDSKGNQMTVNYTRSYGGVTTIKGHDEAMYLFHTQDNIGPPSKEELEGVFQSLLKEYPNAQIAASTLDDFAKGLENIKNTLPVIKGEIGDTWIHGTGVDPKKVAELKALCRLVQKWDGENAWAAYPKAQGERLTIRERFLDELLLVCEHTWGLDMKKYLPDYGHWSRADFDLARKRDVIDGKDPKTNGQGKYSDLIAFGKEEFEKMQKAQWKPSYSFFESSHQEQREYITKAIALLPDGMQKEVQNFINKERVLASEGTPAFSAAYSEKTGTWHFLDKGEELFSIGLPLYQQVGKNSYQAFFDNSLDHLAENWLWAYPDNGKPGFEQSDAPQQDENSPMASDEVRQKDGGWQVKGHFDPALSQLAGAPGRGEMKVLPFEDGWLVEVALTQKPANRKPEGLFLPLTVGSKVEGSLVKIAAQVNPVKTVEGGNQRSHFVQAVVLNSPLGSYTITPLDSGLVSLNEPALLKFANNEPMTSLYFNLYNNLWGTNFKMWYEEDIKARFVIKKAK